MRLALRATGWLLIAAGVLVALYLVYALYYTGLATARAQDELLQSFQQEVGAAVELDLDLDLDLDALEPLDAEQGDAADGGSLEDLADLGEAVAAIEFRRPGEGPILLDRPLMVVEGVTDEVLATGPGRYPGTAMPGQAGNFAVAGHRTTHGGPFWDLDQLVPGDEIHVLDRAGERWVYEVVEQRIVGPTDVSVLADDPLALGRPMLTLTTCHPRWSQTERMIVFAQMADAHLPDVAARTGGGTS